MSFQAYLANVQAKTGKTAADFITLATEKGFYIDGQIPKEIKVSQIIAWLKADYDLGHGHAMAIVALLKGKKLDDKSNSYPKAG